MITFIQSLPQVLQCVGNFDRLQQYFNYHTGQLQTSDDDDEGDDQNISSSVSEQGFRLRPIAFGKTSDSHSRHREEMILLQGLGHTWDKSRAPVLRSLDIKIKRGSITAIVGPIGSGKTTFLHALLGELHHSTPSRPTTPVAGTKSGGASHGEGLLAGETIAYCAQQPWLENGTIYDNIVGAEPWDPERYNVVRSACCLDFDFRELKFGDQTRVGSKGANLSGGQRQRIVSEIFPTQQCERAQHQSFPLIQARY